MSAEVTIDDGVATVWPASREVAAALIEAAGRDGVETVTGRGGIAFRVSEKHAEAAGLTHGAQEGTKEAPSKPAGGPGGGGEGNMQGGVVPPSRAASTETWREFLEDQGVPHESEATRADLIAAWDSR